MPYLRPDERNVECELTGQLLLPGHLHLTQTSRVLKLDKNIIHKILVQYMEYCG